MNLESILLILAVISFLAMVKISLLIWKWTREANDTFTSSNNNKLYRDIDSGSDGIRSANTPFKREDRPIRKR